MSIIFEQTNLRDNLTFYFMTLLNQVMFHTKAYV